MASLLRSILWPFSVQLAFTLLAQINYPSNPEHILPANRALTEADGVSFAKIRTHRKGTNL
jgi:hypothetical protein